MTFIEVPPIFITFHFTRQYRVVSSQSNHMNTSNCSNPGLASSQSNHMSTSNYSNPGLASSQLDHTSISKHITSGLAPCNNQATSSNTNDYISKNLPDLPLSMQSDPKHLAARRAYMLTCIHLHIDVHMYITE